MPEHLMYDFPPSPSTLSDNRKARALMQTIFRIIDRYQNIGGRDEEIFRLFEVAKRVRDATNEDELQRGLGFIDPPVHISSTAEEHGSGTCEVGPEHCPLCHINLRG